MTSLRISRPSDPFSYSTARWLATFTPCLVYFFQPLCGLRAVADTHRPDRNAPGLGMLSLHAEVLGSNETMPAGSIRAICIDGPRVWVGGDCGLACFENGSWNSWAAEDGLPHLCVSALDVNPLTHELWIGTMGGGIARFSGNRFDTFDQHSSGLAGNMIYDIIWADRRAWIATNGGISAFDPVSETWDLYAERRADTLFHPAVTLGNVNGAVYAGQWRGDLLRLPPHANGESLSIKTTVSHLKAHMPDNASITAWTMCPSSAVAATLQGLLIASFDSANTPRLIPFHDAMHPWVHCVACRNGNEYWIGADDGLFVYLDRPQGIWLKVELLAHTTYMQVRSQPSTMALPGAAAITKGNIEPAVFAIAFDRQSVWVGTSAGVLNVAHVPYGADLSALEADPGREKRRTPTGSTTSLPTQSSAAPQIALGLFGPRNRTITLPGSSRSERPFSVPDRQSVANSVLAHNQRRRLKGLSTIALATIPSGYERYLWGLPEDDLDYFNVRPEVIALVGNLTDELLAAEAVLPRLNLVMVTTTSLKDAISSNTQSHPWLYECYEWIPGAHRTIMDHLMERAGNGDFVVAYATQHAPLEVHWWRTYAAFRGWNLPIEVRCVEGAAKQLEARRRGNLAGLLLVSNRNDLAMHLADIERERLACPVVLGVLSLGAGVTAPELGGECEVIIPIGVRNAIALDSVNGLGSDGIANVEIRNEPERPSGDGRMSAPPLRNSGTQHNTAERWYFAADHALAALTRASDRINLRDVVTRMRESVFGEAHYEELLTKPEYVYTVFKNGRWTTRIYTLMGKN